MAKQANEVNNQCFVRYHDLRYEFSHVTYLKLKRAIGAYDCLNLASVSLLRCSFVPKQGQTTLSLDLTWPNIA